MADPEDDQVEELQIVAYRVILPLIIIGGILVTSLSLVVLTRPRLKAAHVNTYFLLLASADLVIFVVSVATAVTLNGCDLRSHDVALYFAHFFFTLFYIVQTFSMYIILWISYDRFLAVWDFKRFHEIQKPGVLRLRLVLTLVMCILIHLKHLFEVQVTCAGDSDMGEGGVEAQPELECDEGDWVINDGLHSPHRDTLWRQIFWVLRGLLVLVVPIVLVVVFNGGIVAALVHRRLNSASAATPRTRGRDLSRIYTILAISATYIVCTVPSLVHATFYADNIKGCRGPYSDEVLRAIANLLLLLEHVTHFVILSFCDLFWAELKRVLQIMRHELKTGAMRASACISSTFRGGEGAPDAGQGDPSSSSSTSPTGPRPDSVISGSVFVISPPEIIVDAHPQKREPSPPEPQTTAVEAPSALATLKLPKGKSPTASVVTLEEDL